MDRAQEEKHLAQSDRHIADAKELIARQRAVLARTVAMGLPSETAEVLLDTLEQSLQMFEMHRERILSELKPNA